MDMEVKYMLFAKKLVSEMDLEIARNFIRTVVLLLFATAVLSVAYACVI